MAVNTLLVISDITREVQRVLHEKMTFVKTINNQFDNMAESAGGGKNGGVMRIRTPAKYTVRNGKTMTIQDTTDTAETLTVATQDGVDLGNFSSAEMANSIQDVSKRYITPAVSTLASYIDSQVLQGVTKAVYNNVGTAGTTPASMTVWGQARAKLNQYLAPKEDRSIQLNSIAMASMVDAYKALFAPTPNISKQYIEGYIAQNSGFEWYENERIYSALTGSDHTTVTINDASIADGDTTVTTAGGTVTVGTVFTIANVLAVHPETKAVYAHNQQFVITAVSTNDWTFSPAWYTSGPNQNVDALPVTTAAVTLVGTASTTYPYHLAYQRDIAAFATQDLPLPKNTEAMRKKIDEISVRVVLNHWDAVNDVFATRIDVLWGYKTIRPELGCRVIG